MLLCYQSVNLSVWQNKNWVLGNCRCTSPSVSDFKKAIFSPLTGWNLYYCTGTQFEIISLYLTSFFKYLHSLNYTLTFYKFVIKGAIRSTSVNPEVTLAMILMQGIKCYFRFPHYMREWCRSVMFLITTKYQITVTHMNSVRPKTLSASPSDRLTGV